MAKFCAECGAALRPEAKFCANCGKPTPAADSAADVSGSAQTPSLGQPVSAATGYGPLAQPGQASAGLSGQTPTGQPVQSYQSSQPVQPSDGPTVNGQAPYAQPAYGQPLYAQPAQPQLPKAQLPIRPDVLTAQPTAQPGQRVNLIEAYKLFWKNYVNFKGRSTRAEYWWAYLANAIVALVFLLPSWIAAGMAIAAASHLDFPGYLADVKAAGAFTLLAGLYGLAVACPMLAIGVRRSHDVGISNPGIIGVYIGAAVLGLLSLIPYIGILFSLALAALGIYMIIVFARQSDYYRTNDEPVTDWLTKQFGH